MNRYDTACHMLDNLDDEGLWMTYDFIEDEIKRRYGETVDNPETDEDLAEIYQFIQGLSDVEHLENLFDYADKLLTERGK